VPRATTRDTGARRGDSYSAAWSAARREVTLTVDPSDVLGWMDASYHVARTLREVLLGRAIWPDCTQHFGDPSWPFSPRGAAIAPARPDYDALLGRHILVIGCGSVGSEAIRALSAHGARWTFVDGARVTTFNLSRQWFGAEEVGDFKVDALQRRVPQSRALRTSLDASKLDVLEALLRADPPDVALLATGTHHHGMLGDLLWRLGIAHVAACCYPQARFFELSIVSPRERTPCLSCFRGHLYRGVPEPAPMTDEIASFLYRPMDDADRERAYTDLVAEPATKIETFRVAELLARCAVELLAHERSPWFGRLLAESTTCLLGGNVARRLPTGDHAYGIRTPGQVIRLGVDDLAGADDTTCMTCGRTLHVTLRDELPAIPDAADAALLSVPAVREDPAIVTDDHGGFAGDIDAV
jgi:hypothetical protein